MSQYDAIASEYKICKQAPWRTYLELFSFKQLLGKHSGESVQDLACGDGRSFSIETVFYLSSTYERALAKAGFERVGWRPLLLDPETPDPEKFADFLRHPQVTFLSARKPK